MGRTLDDIMEFDHVIQVHADGSITDSKYHAPDVIGEKVDKPWILAVGYTGQHGYRGPTMHPSEFVGGRMEEDIRSTPGHYVVCEVREEDGGFPEGDPIGWSVAYRRD